MGGEPASPQLRALLSHTPAPLHSNHSPWPARRTTVTAKPARPWPSWCVFVLGRRGERERGRQPGFPGWPRPLAVLPCSHPLSSSSSPPPPPLPLPSHPQKAPKVPKVKAAKVHKVKAVKVPKVKHMKGDDEAGEAVVKVKAVKDQAVKAP